jgi:hypothetical protein
MVRQIEVISCSLNFSAFFAKNSSCFEGPLNQTVGERTCIGVQDLSE